MSAFDDLRNRYFVGPSGSTIGSGDPGLIRYAGCEVIPHIGGPSYFTALHAAITQPDVAYVYLAGWLFDPDFQIVPGTKLVDLLEAKSKAGVDVRVLGWVMAPEVLNNPAVTSGKVSLMGMDTTVNEPTMKFIQALRTGEPTLVGKALLNVIAHPAGAVHTKFALVGRPSGDVGFTGGIDASSDRAVPTWHDVEVEVRGQVTQGLYDWFRDLWNENISRSPVAITAGATSVISRAPSSPALGPRQVPSVLVGTKHLQSGRTVPKMDFSTLASIGGSIASQKLPTNSTVAFAPSGLFEIKRLWQKAISASDRYVYIEDQSFCSDEVFDWVNKALHDHPTLKVVLLNGRQDPNNPNPGALLKAMRRSINEHLLKGLAQADVDARVGLFLAQGKTVHTKSTVVDDNWALIGSANHMRRSLYTDFEHAVSFMDEAGSGVPNYRRALFNAHLGTPGQMAAADDLGRWFALPYYDPATPRPVSRLHLPFPASAATLTPMEQKLVDELMDADSRKTWGMGLASLAMTAAGTGN